MLPPTPCGWHAADRGRLSHRPSASGPGYHPVRPRRSQRPTATHLDRPPRWGHRVNPHRARLAQMCCREPCVGCTLKRVWGDAALPRLPSGAGEPAFAACARAAVRAGSTGRVRWSARRRCGQSRSRSSAPGGRSPGHGVASGGGPRRTHSAAAPRLVAPAPQGEESGPSPSAAAGDTADRARGDGLSSARTLRARAIASPRPTSTPIPSCYERDAHTALMPSGVNDSTS